MATPVTGLADHKHCEVCGKSIALDGRVCSPECKARLQEAFRMKRRSVYIFVVLFALILAVTAWPYLSQMGKGP